VTAPTPDQLREQMYGELFDALNRTNPLHYDDAAADLADMLLPLVLAYGHACAADALNAAADRHQADHPGGGPCAEAEDDRDRAVALRAGQATDGA